MCICARARVLMRPGAHGAHPRRARRARTGLSFPALSAAARPAAACRCSALQEQKGELRKRLSYTTHKLEKLETEFDSTRHYLEIELRRAQEELEKVTEKLRRSGGGVSGRGRSMLGGAQSGRGSGICRPPEPATPFTDAKSRAREVKLTLCQEQLNQDLNPGVSTARDRLLPATSPSPAHSFFHIDLVG